MALAACSSDPPRCGEGGTSCADAGMPLDRPDVDVVQLVDLGVDAGALLIDDPPASDVSTTDVQPDVQTTDARADAAAVDDVPQDVPGVDVAVDVQLVDVGEDAGALDSGTDAGELVDVQAVDVASDRVDVVDVVDAPRDAGPVDGGPVVYDLEAVRAGLTAHFAGRRTLPPPTSTSRDCPDDPYDLSCSVTRATGAVNFYARVCFGTGLTGALRLGTGGLSSVSITGGGGGSSATTLRVTASARVGGRQSIHVQIAAAPYQGEVGFGGIAGTTVDPALADLWLLGCSTD